MILRLTLTKKWFDMIESGEKKEEYREIKQFWSSRLLWHEYRPVTCTNSLKDQIEVSANDRFSSGIFRTDFDRVEFKNGYRKDARTMLVECLGITYGQSNPKWSDNWQGDVYIIKLGKVINSRQ